NLQLSVDAIAKLQACRWSGNVRELQHTLEKAVIRSENTVLQPADFYLQKSNSADLGFDNLTLEDAEKILIQNSLKRNKDNLSAVAAELGITRPTLYSKMKKYNV
ncbi:helix-turn-helix domain-containing protein, partial [Candidatus Symbiothrix dinenymphae]|uniref:helix-turn-helix domain-containing protein n=1 Tax=Candidatus Symbiothrix dinenymphae TaxID=467085 RepID=UPI000AB216BD